MYFQISWISLRQTFSRKFCCSPHTWMLLNHFWLSCIQDLTSLFLPLCRPSARLSGRLDKELPINLTLSVNLIWYFTVFPIFCVSIDTEKVMFFSVFLTDIWTGLGTYPLVVRLIIVFTNWHVVENQQNFFLCLESRIIYVVSSCPVFTCIMAEIRYHRIP